MNNNIYINKLNEIVELQSKDALLNSNEMLDEINKITDEEKWRYFYRFAKSFPNTDNYIKLIKSLITDKNLVWDEKLCILNTVNFDIFTNPDMLTHELNKLIFILYKQIQNEFESNLKVRKNIRERNTDVVLVTIQQFLGIGHAPSKTLLDRAYCLKNNMHKKVIIINTAEMFGGARIKGFNMLYGNYDESLNDKEFVEYNGEKFPFMQFEQDTPNVETTELLCDYVEKLKPSYIINIGKESLMIEQLRRLVPVLNINTVPSQIAMSSATVQMVGESMVIDDSVKELLSILNRNENNIIKGRFTSSLPIKKTHIYSKKMIGVPEDVFVISIIGTRLDNEMNDAFLAMLNRVLSDDVWVVIIGKMDSYSELLQEKYPNIKKYSTYLGMQSDVLAILEQCDLYINPPRRGGGTSVIEAMYMGLPVVSLNYGDVALGCGEEFCVKDLNDMEEEILHYNKDSIYYNKKSLLAKKRADYMLDSKTAFCEIIQKFESIINR